MVSKVDLYNKICPENNNNKINKIFDFWFLRFDHFINLNNKYTLKDLEEVLKKSQNKNVIYAINQILNGNKRFFFNKRKYNNYFIKLVLNLFFKFSFFKYLIISGGETKYTKLNDLISNLWIRAFINSNFMNFDFSTANKKKIEFIELLKVHNIYKQKEINFLKNYLPVLFFYTRKHIILKKLKIFGSLDNFLNDYNYLKFFLIIENLKLIGTMHGSGYGQFKKHLTEKFEKNISDEFIFWFPFNKSKFIGRYTLNTKIKNSEHNIFWIGKNNFNEFDKIDLPDQYKHQKYEDHLDYIDRELNKIENIFFVTGKNNNKELWLPSNITILNKNIKIETQINNKSDILIFDCISQTLLYFAIKFSIPFIIIIFEKNVSEITGLTDEFKKFCSMLEGEEFIFNYKEIDKVQKKIISLKDIENYNFEKKKLSNILEKFN